MTRTASRSLIALVALLCFPVLARAQASHTATPAVKSAMTAKPATPPAAKATSAAPVVAVPSTASAARVTTPAASATPGPARDARGRFIAKSAAPSAGNHATCKDGSAWEGARRAGACARHGGVKSWN